MKNLESNNQRLQPYYIRYELQISNEKNWKSKCQRKNQQHHNRNESWHNK